MTGLVANVIKHENVKIENMKTEIWRRETVLNLISMLDYDYGYECLYDEICCAISWLEHTTKRPLEIMDLVFGDITEWQKMKKKY